MSVEMTTPGAAGWIEFSGPDTTAAKKFYSDVMGWTVADMPMQDGHSYPGIMVGEGPIGGFSPMPAEKGSWTIYVTVDDVDARTKRARQAGAKVIQEPTDLAGVGRMSRIADPQGAVIALITYESMRRG